MTCDVGFLVLFEGGTWKRHEETRSGAGFGPLACELLFEDFAWDLNRPFTNLKALRSGQCCVVHVVSSFSRCFWRPS